MASLADDNWKAAAELDGLVEVSEEQLGGEFSIAVDGTDKVLVKLEGGERLDLQYEAGQLCFSRWPDVDDKEPLVHGGHQFRVAALAPVPYGSGRVFRVALANMNPRAYDGPSFTSRPTGIWAEVTADRGAGEAAVVYPVTDVEFEPNDPGPVLRLCVPTWPLNVVHLRSIRLWLMYDGKLPRFVHNGPIDGQIKDGDTTFVARWYRSGDHPQVVVDERHDHPGAVADTVQIPGGVASSTRDGRRASLLPGDSAGRAYLHVGHAAGSERL